MQVERAQQQVAELEALRAQLKLRVGNLVQDGGIASQPSDAALHSLEVCNSRTEGLALGVQFG